jgi:molybdate transport system substrate-binding protein
MALTKRTFTRAALGLLATTLAPTMAHAQPRPPIVLAAASLQESLTKAADVWAAKGHVRPVLSFAASSALARQIVNGAPADLFISADEDWMDYVAKAPARPDGKGSAGWIATGTRVNFLTNRLALIAPANSPAKITIAPGFPLAPALGATGRLATGQIGVVPAGKYAKQALINLKVWPSVETRIAGAESVRAALALVARGEAPLGIVYATDAAVEPKVRTLALIPAQYHSPIVYPIAGLTHSGNFEGESFRRFLISPQGRAIFAAYGFGTQ